MTEQKITTDFLQSMIQETFPNITIKSFEVSTGSDRGDNYTSMLYRVNMTGNTSSEENWNLSIIYKCLPDSQARRDAFKSETLFCNEVAFYTKALPALLQFQNSQGVSNGFSLVPKCYVASEDFIVLEDLKTRGFSMTDRKTGLDFNHCSAALRELGRFHALSLAMKCQEPVLFQNLVASVVKEVFFTESNEEYYRDYYKTAANNAVSMVNNCFTEDEKNIYLNKLKSFVDEKSFFNHMVEYVSPIEPIAVLCHGDFWSNNILFKYTDSGEIEDVCFIDFQCVRYASPGLDLVTLLYCCTSHKLRAEKMDELLNIYLHSLSKALKKLGCADGSMEYCHVNNLKEMIQDEVHICGKFGLGLSLDMIPIITCDSDQAPDLYDDKLFELEQALKPVATTNIQCQQKLAELVKELVDNGDL